MKNDGEEIEIVEVHAVDITERQIRERFGRKVIFLEEKFPTIKCFGFRLGNKAFYIPKDILDRNIKGPPRRTEYSNW